MIDKNKLIEVAAKELNLSRRRFPNKYNATFEGCDVKPTTEQYRDAEAALIAICKELPEAVLLTYDKEGEIELVCEAKAAELYNQLKEIAND